MTPPIAQRRTHPWIRHAVSRAISRAVSLAFFVVVTSPFLAPPLAQGQTPIDEPSTETENFVAKQYLKPSTTASLIGLNKRSGQAKKLRAPVGHSLRFETLTISLLACTRILYPRHEDSAALLSISSSEKGVLFQGWMYAQYPSLSAMDHPIYNVWVVRCLP